MVCEHSSRAELSGYADGELAPDRGRWWNEHVAGCPACRDELARLQSLRESLRNHLSPREPSSAFRDALRQRIREEQQDAVGTTASRRRAWEFGLAATLLFAVGVGVGRVVGGGARDPMPDEVVAGHVRSLEVDHLVDVASSEHHVVKPWFAGKLDFSPPVPDLASNGFTLLGARVDYLDGRAVAALVYGRGPHRINLLVWPDRKASPCGHEPVMVRQGFNLSHGGAGGMEFWAISDLNRQELEQFVSHWQREAAAGERSCR